MPPPAERPTPTAAAFEATALRSRLIDADRLLSLSAEAGAGSPATAEQLAGHLVAAGALTRFQAEKLLGGFWQGLAVGPYRILCPVGRGGMGIVYLAHRVRANKPPRLVAVKLLSPKRAADEPRTLARFVREMDIGRELPPHPHLTRTLEAGVHEGVHVIAMEYVPGPTVKQLVSDGGPLPVNRAARIFADAATGLLSVHQAGYVHRDLKPSNIVVTTGGRAKVLDFGFALRRGETPTADPSILGGQGYTLGTMDFLPPEQAVNAVAVGAETDVYSLGCSLYFAVSGRNPFPDGSAREKMRMHRAMEPIPLTALVPAIHDDFTRLVRWTMAKRPEQRPQSMDVVARELDRWADPVPKLPAPVALTDDWERQLLRDVEARWLAHRNAAVAAEGLVVLDDVTPPNDRHE
jgi:eukaryotic-like serine/threonine-protein kinase